MSDEDRERIAKELAKAKMDLAKAVANAEENELERAIDAEQDARDKRMDAIQDWAQKVGQAISAVSDLFTAMYDGQISKIEEQMDAEEAHHEAQIAQIDELEEHGTITKEEAELRKREAEARTAKAQEALEKKKAQAEYKRAVAEKANILRELYIDEMRQAEGNEQKIAEIRRRYAVTVERPSWLCLDIMCGSRLMNRHSLTCPRVRRYSPR